MMNVSSPERPLGVTILAILAAVQGILAIILGLMVLFTPFAFVGISALIAGAINLYLAWGLWTLKRWAFVLTVVFMVIDLVFAVISLFSRSVTVWQAILSMIIPAVILIYFLADSNVRTAFHA
jgi:uncharacterized membrane protein (DUF2068 family)